jgi:cardiolipin synthase
MRSFWLNFEATLLIYCKSFTEELFVIQQEYLSQSIELDIDIFSKRGNWEMFKENTVLLVSPLL